MKPTPEMLEAYKRMAVSAPDTMKDIIKAHLAANCRKYDEKLFDRCFNHLQETVLEMLGGQEAAEDGKLEGAIHADTVFRICRDYYDDEIWKKEDEEEAKEKAEAEKRAEEIRKKDEERRKKAEAKRKNEVAKKAMKESDMFKDNNKPSTPEPYEYEEKDDDDEDVDEIKNCSSCGLAICAEDIKDGLCPACHALTAVKPAEPVKPKPEQLEMFAMFGGK